MTKVAKFKIARPAVKIDKATRLKIKKAVETVLGKKRKKATAK